MCRFKTSVLLLAGVLLRTVVAQEVEVVAVQSQPVERTMLLPGEILPFQRVTLQARANGFVERVLVDRGSVVTQGQLLVSIVAPEIAAQVAEAESKAEMAEALRAEAEARLAGAQATYDRLKTASETPGAIAGNELIQAEKLVDAARAVVRAHESATRAARSAVEAAQVSEQFLQVTAPFSGVITERYVHPGALVGQGATAGAGLLELEQLTRLRLVVAVPESSVAGIRRGKRVEFRAPAYPGRAFTGTVARLDRSMDPKTRTMPVELDVLNAKGELSPGMFPEVLWPASRSGESLLVPPSAVVVTTERTFVIRVKGDRAEWVNVRKGSPSGELVEIFGPLSPEDLVVRRASDELRDGTRVAVRKAS